ESGFELMSGEDFKVISEIESGGAIKDAAVLLNELDEFHFAQVLRPLKHQVFEEMSKARTILWLDSKPDVVIDGDGHGRRRSVLGENDFQAIWELVISQRDVKSLGSGPGGCGRPERAYY